MAFPISEVGVAGVVAMFAIDKLYLLAKNRKENGKAKKRCVDSDGVQLALQNNAIMASSVRQIGKYMEKLSENSTIQVTLLKQLNGKN